MKTMIASALVFARETKVMRNRQRLDLRSLLESLADSRADQGYDIVMLPGDDVVMMGDSLALGALFGTFSRMRCAMDRAPRSH